MTTHIPVVHYISGNPTSPYGVRQLPAAFLPFAQVPVTHRRIRPLWNQSLTNCKFCNSFILTFMHVMGGGGVLQNPDFLISSSLSTIPFLFILLRTLLQFFALNKNSTPLFSMVSALFDKKQGCGYSSRRLLRGIGCPKGGSFLPLPGWSFCRMSNLRR